MSSLEFGLLAPEHRHALREDAERVPACGAAAFRARFAQSPLGASPLKRTLAIVGLVILTAAPLGGQEQDQRAKLRELPAGTPVTLMTMSGMVVEGAFESITDAQVVIVASGGQTREIATREIQTLSATRRDPVWNGILAGAGIGFGGGAGLGAAWFHGSGRYGAKPPGYERDFITGIGVVGSVVGALIGWRLDARRTRTEVIYQAAPVP